MAHTLIRRVKCGDPLIPQDINQFADAIETMRAAQKAGDTTLAAVAATACVAAASKRRLSRRWLLGFGWKPQC